MANLSGIVQQLKKERDRVQQQLSGLNAALEAFAGVYRGQNGTKPRRKISAKGRARIAAAQRARWARVNGQKKVVSIARPKRTMSASARRKIAAAQRRRWAKVRPRRQPSRAGASLHLDFRVLRPGVFQDGDVGVGVFPEGEQVLVGGERHDACRIGFFELSRGGIKVVHQPHVGLLLAYADDNFFSVRVHASTVITRNFTGQRSDRCDFVRRGELDPDDLLSSLIHLRLPIGSRTHIFRPATIQ